MSRCCTWFADNNVCLPHAGMCELFDRTPVTRRMIILRRADHMHFRDNAEEMDESVRNMTFPEELSWILREMRPIAELSSGETGALIRPRSDARRHGSHAEANPRSAAISGGRHRRGTCGPNCRALRISAS
jgi:hypothetical protein